MSYDYETAAASLRNTLDHHLADPDPADPTVLHAYGADWYASDIANALADTHLHPSQSFHAYAEDLGLPAEVVKLGKQLDRALVAEWEGEHGTFAAALNDSPLTAGDSQTTILETAGWLTRNAAEAV